jgi:hypothetical protein
LTVAIGGQGFQRGEIEELDAKISSVERDKPDKMAAQPPESERSGY